MGPYKFVDTEGQPLPVEWPELTESAKAYADSMGYSIQDADGNIVYPEEG
ncbi:hypothetical protein IXEL_4 [Microbacterium phage Ixel]|nr:hypothetical protein IXEL_4 [Microbacterium phage Ixel]